MYPRALIRGNPPLTTHTQLLCNIFFFASSLTSAISHFFAVRKDNRTRVKWRRSHEHTLLPNLPTPETFFPPHLPHIHRQAKHHARFVPFLVATHLWRNVSLAFCEIQSSFYSFAVVATEEGEGVDSTKWKWWRQRRRRRRWLLVIIPCIEEGYFESSSQC